jgi:hypothetical protein
MGFTLCALLALVPEQTPCHPPACLMEAAFSLDKELRGQAVPYDLQPGDIFLATDIATWAQIGHALAGGTGVHHSGIIFQRSNGELGLLEAGPFNSNWVETPSPWRQLVRHTERGDRIWIRRPKVPLTPEQSAALTKFAEAQDGKPFAWGRIIRQITPFRARGPFTSVLGKPHGDRPKWYCTEMVCEAMIAAGLVDPAVMRPAATYPRDLFFGRSTNAFLDRNLPINDVWEPPARWVLCK